MAFVSILVLGASLSIQAPSSASSCKEWQACRQLALEAAERKDYELFHDLAWKAFNAGPRNTPELMAMLARAQALSGRPGDALVMLNRLAAIGGSTDVATSEDFAGVRALPGWPELEAKLAGKPPEAKIEPPVGLTPKPDVRPEPAPAVSEKSSTAEAAAAKPAPVKPRSNTEAAVGKAMKGAKPVAKAADAAAAPLTFSTSGLNVVGLAYDAVSGRFIVGDARDRRLLVLGERSGRMSSLAGIDAGFQEIGGLEIDVAEGDLWVVSSSSDSRTSAVHKLQLISGRVLSSVRLPEDAGPARLADVAVTPQSVLVLDAAGRRVYRVAKKGKTVDLAMRLPTEASTLAPASDTVAYAAFDRGVLRLDLSARTMAVVDPQKADLSGLSWIRWFRGSLVGLRKDASGAVRPVRVRLDDAGRAARAVDVLDEGEATAAGPATAGLVGATFYYLAGRLGSEDVEVRKLPLK